MTRSLAIPFSRVSLIGRFALVGASILIGSVCTAVAADAIVVATPLISTSFSGSTVPNQWSDPSGTNAACLTAGTMAASTPIPGCDLATPDAAGSGVLQLTSNSGGQVGTTFSQVALPTSAGLDINFDTFQFNGTGADGISFALAAADPTNPAPPAVVGPSGGSLGYSAYGSAPGLPDGYLGIGLDAYGNFLSTEVGGTSCAGPGQLSESISARGPGNGTNGYCVLATTHVDGLSKTVDDAGTSTRSSSIVPVEVAINPTASVVTAMTSGLSVPADSWLIAYSPVGVTQTNGSWSATYSLSGLLPTTLSGAGHSDELANTADFPSSWINPATGIPYMLTFGWTASTGAVNEIHDVADITATSLVGEVPVLSVTNSDNEGGNFVDDNSVTYTLTPTVDTDLAENYGAESDNLSLTDTFPTGVTPLQPTSLSPDWYCPAPSGQTISCVYTVSSPLAPGTTLPVVSVPTSVSSNANTLGVLTAVARVSSLDGEPGLGTDAGSATDFVAHSSPTNSQVGQTVTLSETGLPAGADGDTVTMVNGTSDVCTFVLSASVTFCSTTSLAPGTYAHVTAVFSGDTILAPQTVAVPTFTVAGHAACTVYFANASSVLSSAARSRLTLFAARIAILKLNHVSIIGYTSSTGTETLNLKLGINRAKSTEAFLKSVLAQLDSSPVTFTIQGKGDQDFATNPTSSALNRRSVSTAT